MLFRSLIKRILDKLLPSRLAVAEKTEITEMLVDMQNRVEAGTKKIDEQIPVLQKILKDIESKDEAIGIIQAGDDPAAKGFAKLEFTSLDKKLEEFATKTGASKEEAREALVDAANEAYPPGSPKIMRMDDDEMLEAYIDTREKMGMKMDLLEDIVDRTGTKIKEESAFDLIRKGIEKGQIKEAGMSVSDEVEEALKINKQRQVDLKALEDKMADPENIDKMTKPGGLADLMQEVQDDKVIPFMKYQPNPKPKKAMGGRVGMQLGGGIMKALMSLMRKGDEKQVKGVIRDPKTDLERLKDTDPKQPTIRDMEDLPGKLGYDERNKMKLQKLVEREKVRAILADRLGVDPKDIPEENIDMAIAEGMGMFSQGGGVGSLFKRKAK